MENDEKENSGEDYSYFEDNQNLPDGAIEMQVQHKTITDSNGEPALEITKTITYDDGSVQKFVDNQPLEKYE